MMLQEGLKRGARTVEQKQVLACGQRDNLLDPRRSWPSKKKRGRCAQLEQPVPQDDGEKKDWTAQND